MSNDSNSAVAETSNDDADGVVLERLRDAVTNLLLEGISPPQISFAMAVVGTELGFMRAPNPVGVFPVMLAGIVRATTTHLESLSSPDVDSMTAGQSIGGRSSTRSIH